MLEIVVVLISLYVLFLGWQDLEQDKVIKIVSDYNSKNYNSILKLEKDINNMPSKSKPQAKLMAAAAHTKGGYDGVSQKVGKEFNKADKGTGILKGKKTKPKSKKK